MKKYITFFILFSLFIPVSASAVEKQTINFSSICDLDPLVPNEWKNVQEWAKINLGCSRPYRFENYKIKTKPKTILTKLKSDVTNCKLQNNSMETLKRWTGFPRANDFLSFTKSANFQVVPLQFTDYKTSSDPSLEYKTYFNFISDYLVNASDVKIYPNFKIPSKYYQMKETLKSYDIEYGNGDKFKQDMLAVTKDFINYQGTDIIIVVVPKNVPVNEFFAGGLPWQEIITPQGTVKKIYVVGPTSLTQRTSNNSSTAPDPWITIHEAIGHHSGLNDTLGDSFGNIGMAGWGNMSGINGDFLIWDKWLMGFVADSQIVCLNNTTKNLIWIRPNTVKDSGVKGVMIPLDFQHSIFIESQRSTGYNFKMPKKFNGALIYLINTSIQENDIGMTLLNTDCIIDNISGMKYGNATLKQGQSFVYLNWKISIVESGDFGDVVSITKQ